MSVPRPPVSESVVTGPTSGVSAATKVLVFVEENHSLHEMRTQMPLLNHLAKRNSVATDYTAMTHPSLPNYLAMMSGSTFGISDDGYPSAHPLPGPTVFDQALKSGKTAKTYAESMPSNCDRSDSYPYAVKHNPWAYFTHSRRRCNRHDVPLGSPTQGLHHDITHATLPNVGLVVPNLLHDGHDAPLSTANAWLSTWMPQVLAGPDFTSGRLTVIVTADEDDQTAGNKVATVVMHAGMHHRRVTTPLNHYSLTGYIEHVLGVPRLRHAKRGFARAFHLR